MAEGVRRHVHAQNVGAEATFLEAGPKTIRPLEQRGGSTASGEGGPTNDLGGRVVTETKGNEPMDGPDEPGGGLPEPLG